MTQEEYNAKLDGLIDLPKDMEHKIDIWILKIQIRYDLLLKKNSKFNNGEVTIGMNDGFPFEWKIAHEIAHGRNLYNNGNVSSNRTDSEYYGNNYNYIKNRHKRLLKSINPINTHDAELSESYSDLMGLRVALHNAGIVDGTQRRYRNRDIKQYLNTDNGYKDRYLQYHPKINRVRKALNRIYNEGGKIENPA